MRALAAYVMRGRMQAVLATGICAFLALTIPVLAPLSYISGAVVALIALRQNVADTAGIMGLALLFIGGLAMLSSGSVMPALVYAALFWLPAACFALVLRHTGAQGMLVAAAAAAAAAVLVAIHALAGDVPAWWSIHLEQIVAEHDLGIDGETIKSLSRLMTGFAVGGVLVGGQVVTVLLARWWQSLLYNPGGFGPEFHALRLPRGMVLALVMITAYALLSRSETGTLQWDLVLVGILMLMFQGLAIVHASVARYKVHSAWLVLMYLVLFTMQIYAVLALALLGLADNWIDFRARKAGA